MKYLLPFPLLVLPVLVYNLLAWMGSVSPSPAERYAQCAAIAGSGVHPLACELAAPLVRLPMAATVLGSDGQTLERVRWAISAGDLLLVFALVMLFAELLKATTTRKGSITNHALSLVVFIFGLVEFLLMPGFATSTFFLILLMALLDVLAGFIVTIATSRRDVSFGR
jgi:hypothetical protein